MQESWLKIGNRKKKIQELHGTFYTLLPHYSFQAIPLLHVSQLPQDWSEYCDICAVLCCCLQHIDKYIPA